MKGYTVDHVRAAQARMALTGQDGEPLTQRAAAEELLRVNPVTLNRIENGKAKVSLELLDRMAALYGVTKEWLLGEPDNVDEFEQARERVANALSKIGAGFEDFTEAVDELYARVSQSRDSQTRELAPR